jgi:hypothetical protein
MIVAPSGMDGGGGGGGISGFLRGLPGFRGPPGGAGPLGFRGALYGLRRVYGLHRRARRTTRAHAPSHQRRGRGEQSPGADVAAVRAVPAQMWQGASRVPAHTWQRRAESRRRCGRGEPSPGADVGSGDLRPIAHSLISRFSSSV